MRKIWDDMAWEEYLYWQVHDKKLLGRINELLKETERTPFAGKGKPEPLKGKYQGFWSRRINDEHRLIYRIKGDTIEIVSCKGHYED